MQGPDPFLFLLGPLTLLDSRAEIVMPAVTALLRGTFGIHLPRNVFPMSLEVRLVRFSFIYSDTQQIQKTVILLERKKCA